MKKLMSVFVALLMLLSVVSMAFAQDTNSSDSEVLQSETNEQEAIGLPNPASVYCVERGYNIENRIDESNGGQYGVCLFGDGNECDEWAFYRGECGQEYAAGVSQEAEPTENTTDDMATDADVEEAGVTPDSPLLWGLDRAIERISLALTLGKSAKAQKGLAHAQERLMEVKVMIAEKKMDKAAKAEKAHKEDIEDVQDAVEQMDGEEPEEQLAEQTEIGQELDEQQKEMDQIKVKAKAKLQLTPEQQAKLDELVASLKDNIGEAKVKVEVKKNKIKINIQAKTGKSASPEQGREGRQ